jgi:hypothetical protein
MSDRIVFSKCDLLPSMQCLDEHLVKFKSLFPAKDPCFVGTQFSPILLLPPESWNPGTKGTQGTIIPAHHLTDSAFCEHVFKIKADNSVNTDELEKLFTNDSAIIRAKGHIHTQNGWMLFNYTLSGMNLETCQAKQNIELVIIAEKSIFDLPIFKERLLLSNILLYKTSL